MATTSLLGMQVLSSSRQMDSSFRGSKQQTRASKAPDRTELLTPSAVRTL